MCHDRAILMIYFRTEVDKNYWVKPEVIILADYEKLVKRENVTTREYKAARCSEVNLPPACSVTCLTRGRRPRRLRPERMNSPEGRDPNPCSPQAWLPSCQGTMWAAEVTFIFKQKVFFQLILRTFVSSKTKPLEILSGPIYWGLDV